MNSKATYARRRAFSIDGEPSSHGRTAVRPQMGHSEGVAEGVPVGHGKAKMIGHGPTFDDLGGIVMFESQRVLEERH